MSDSFKNDDGRRIYGNELALECSKYADAVNDLMWCGEYSGVGFDDIHLCIIGEVMDLDHEIVSDEGIKKGELHKRDRERFARGVFKAFFDEKIIDEGQYDRLFRNLRANLLKDYLKQQKGKRLIIPRLSHGGIELRSGRVLPPNEKPV